MALEPLASVRALVAAYRSSRYVVDTTDGARVILRVDEDTPAALRAWIGSGAAACYITACNPASRVLRAETRGDVSTEFGADGFAFRLTARLADVALDQIPPKT